MSEAPLYRAVSNERGNPAWGNFLSARYPCTEEALADEEFKRDVELECENQLLAPIESR